MTDEQLSITNDDLFFVLTLAIGDSLLVIEPS